MEKILENLQILNDAIIFAETEHNANYVIGTQDKQLLDETIKLVKNNVPKSNVKYCSLCGAIYEPSK